MWDIASVGRRRRFVLRVLSAHGSYPQLSFERNEALYRASSSLVFTVVPSEPPNEWGWNELAWADLGEIRFWGALAFAIPEGKGFYGFYPVEERSETPRTIWAERLDVSMAEKIAGRVAEKLAPQAHDLHWHPPDTGEIGALYDALLAADNLLLRGVNCYLKSHMLWKHPMFAEEMGINLYIALEAGLSVLRRRLSVAEKRDVSYQDVYDHIRERFTCGDALVEYWEDCRDDRNIVIHPDCHLGPQVMHPRSADDIWELFDPMLSLYRYVLIGRLRPSYEEITGDVDSLRRELATPPSSMARGTDPEQS
jgi:hypothetical protein